MLILGCVLAGAVVIAIIVALLRPKKGPDDPP